MVWIITGLFVSYFIGSIPTAYIFGRVLKGIDIRRFGSGNVGATNVLRVLGKGPGISVLALDIIKGLVTVLFLGNFISSRTIVLADQTIEVLLGIGCICGHNWTIFLGFRGGKGVAVTLGVLLGLAVQIIDLRLILIFILITWVLVFFITRIVSIASVIAAVALPIYMLLFKQSFFLIVTSIALCIFILIRHKNNLIRLLRKEEPRLSFKK